METMEAHSNKTDLRGRTLWYDGSSTVSEERLYQLVAERASTEGLFVDQMSDAICQYNKFVPKDQQICIKGSVFKHSLSWVIPTKFVNLDVKEYVEDRLWDELEIRGWNKSEVSKQGAARILRTEQELNLYEKAGLLDVIRTLIYIINTLHENDVVWGVGRGSSVASYVLYLIGVHDVDSVEYDLNITDFLRPE